MKVRFLSLDITIERNGKTRVQGVAGSIERVRPITEGMVRKGGRNQEPSQIKKRPPPPGAIK